MLVILEVEKVIWLPSDGDLRLFGNFYDELNKSLTEKMGLVRNSYDPCIYNKRTEDGNITVCIHVDDLKVSSVSE